MSRLGAADIAQRGITLTLFGVTMYGALVFGDGAVDIIYRKVTSGPIGSAPVPEIITTPPTVASSKVPSK